MIKKGTQRKQILGINDDVDYCSCCGKQGLKKVVWMQDTETGEINHFGTSCAAKHANILFGEISKEANRIKSGLLNKVWCAVRNSPEGVAYEKALAEANQHNWTFQQRIEFLRPTSIAKDKAEKRIKSEIYKYN